MANRTTTAKVPEWLSPLSEIISFEELKRLRLVSVGFNNVVKKLPRYENFQLKLGSKGLKEFNQRLPVRSKWKNICLSQYEFKRHHFSSNYWKEVQRTLTTLVFHKVRILCDELAELANGCDLLENIIVEKVYFQKFKETVGENGLQQEVTSYCPHLTVPQPIQFRTASIRKITFTSQNVIPICVLEVLRRKCNGRLVEFGCNDQTMTTATRQLCIPSRVLEQNTIIEILKENVATLRKISFCNNICGETMVASIPEHVPNLMLHSARFGNSDYENSAPRVYMTSLQALHENAINLGTVFSLQELELKFFGTSININLWLPNLMNHIIASIKILRLEFQGSLTGPDDFGLNSLQHANNLNTLSIIHKNGTGKINQEFLKTLPASLKNLTVCTSPNELCTQSMFFPFIENIRSENMTKLCIENAGESFKDKHMHEIIRKMPSLQDLQIVGATQLFDHGLCSYISNISAEEILKCKSYFLLSAPPLKFEEIKRHSNDALSLARLTSLRKVTFKKCNISDVSIRLAFHLPNIRNVDLSNNLNVSDIGLSWLCQQNPSIEQLVIQDNIRVSHYGINRLVTNHSTLVKIVTSKKVHDRHFIGLEYPLCVHFDKVVTVLASKL